MLHFYNIYINKYFYNIYIIETLLIKILSINYFIDKEIKKDERLKKLEYVSFYRYLYI